MVESRLKALYLLGFIAFVLLAASPFAESVDNLLMYVAIPLFLLLSVLALYSWQRARDGREESGSTWPKRVETFLRKLPPF
jgi:membrane protein implicated in regulation of membrane protease activity